MNDPDIAVVRPKLREAIISMLHVVTKQNKTCF